MNIKQRLKLVSLALLAFAIYILVPITSSIIISILNVDFETAPFLLKMIYLIATDILVASSIMLIFNEEIKLMWKDLMKNHKQYFNDYLKYWFLALGLMIISNVIIGFFVKGGPENQNMIEEIFKKYPFYIFTSAVIFAPLVEELVFRLGIRHIFKNNYIYIAVSGLLFGFMHVMSADNIMSELIYIIPYSIPGFIFAYVLTKSKNVFVPMGLHLIHNGFLITLQFIVLVFG